MDRFDNRIRVRTIVFLATSWILLALLNISFKRVGLYQDVPAHFPLSIFSGPTVHFSGIPYLLLFLVVIACVLRFAPKFAIYQVWLIGLSLIVLGNLGQGNWDAAFQQPFYESGIQYYHDASKVSSWLEWLRTFNASQQELLTHTRTHPPFAVLIHYWLLQISGNSLTFLAITFVLISSLSIVLVWYIFEALGVPQEKCNLLSILFSVVPAVNIYSAVSLDGIILTSATLFLYGIVVLHRSDGIPLLGLLSMLIGLVITNLLTYGGVFLVAIAGILAMKEFMLSRKSTLAIYLAISVGIYAVSILAMSSLFGYSHIQGFLTASAIENPDGFRGLHMPLEYLATRVEGICEILLFLSFGFLAMLFHPNRLNFSWFDWRRTDIGIMLSGIVVLLAMFLCGAYRTGETARAALFIYPYIMLALTNANIWILRDIIILAGLQTFGMQLLGGYFW